MLVVVSRLTNLPTTHPRVLCFDVVQARELEKIIQEHCYSSSSEDEDGATCALLQLELRVLSVHLPELQEVDTLAST